MPSGATSGFLGAVIGSFKSVTTRRVHRIRKTPGMPVWQRNYYEHIVRTERALNAIREYITDNPARWRLDRDNTGADGPDPFAADLWRLLKEETP
jgi:putative transposase